jgi:hypothetical protein
MSKPPPLTDSQRRRLGVLEPALRNAVDLGDYDTAARLGSEIQAVLRPTGHETRLMQAKNWVFQAAMEAGKLTIAEKGFVGIRLKSAHATRVYLEATVLLAICYLRQREFAKAEPLIAEALRRTTNVVSERKQRQFRRRMIRRFEEESVLAALIGDQQVSIDAAQIESDAATMLQTKTEDEILAAIGAAVPPEVIAILVRVHEFALKQLPPSDVKFLPKPQDLTRKREVGSTVFDAAKRVVWRSLCDPNNEVYKIWYEQGMKGLLSKRVLAVAVGTALSGARVGILALAAAVTALVLKVGIDIFCESAKPEGVMIAQRDHSL